MDEAENFAHDKRCLLREQYIKLLKRSTDKKRPYEVKALDIDSNIDKQMDYFSFKHTSIHGEEMRQVAKDYIATMKKLRHQEEIDRKIK